MDSLSPKERSWNMRRIKGKNTTPEIQIRKELFRQGLRFRLYGKDLPGNPDIAMAKHHLAIFVHGCFWHSHRCQKGRRPKTNSDYWNLKLEGNIKRDKRNIKRIKEIGWTPIVIWECEIAMDISAAAAKVIKFV